jgi:integrase
VQHPLASPDRRQVQKKRGGPSEIREPKYGSERTVFLPAEVVEILSRHVAAGHASSDGWLFTGASGQPVPPTTVNSWWLRTRKAAKVSEVVHIRALRHFYASGLIAAGCDMVTVQRALGHRSPSVTLNTYSHLWPTAEDRTRSRPQTSRALPLRTPCGLKR